MTQDALQTTLQATSVDVADMMTKLMPLPDGLDARLVEAMRYSVMNGGKRIRPFLVLATADLFHVERTSALRVACALEMIHCYSLVHDDLPAMDDDVLRRGKPTCHIEFDEATAILAGDALLTLAFEVLSDVQTHEDPHVRLRLITELSKAAGMSGMVGGQMIDLEAEHHSLDMAQISRLQRMKTGALITYACLAGALLGKADEVKCQTLIKYGHDLGLAFQIADDLLDVDGTAQETGKKVGKDAARGKETFVSLLGVDQARRQAHLLSQQACDHLNEFERGTEILKDLAQFVVNRRS